MIKFTIMLDDDAENCTDGLSDIDKISFFLTDNIDKYDYTVTYEKSNPITKESVDLISKAKDSD